MKSYLFNILGILLFINLQFEYIKSKILIDQSKLKNKKGVKNLDKLRNSFYRKDVLNNVSLEELRLKSKAIDHNSYLGSIVSNIDAFKSYDKKDSNVKYIEREYDDAKHVATSLYELIKTKANDVFNRKYRFKQQFAKSSNEINLDSMRFSQKFQTRLDEEKEKEINAIETEAKTLLKDIADKKAKANAKIGPMIEKIEPFMNMGLALLMISKKDPDLGGETDKDTPDDKVDSTTKPAQPAALATQPALTNKPANPDPAAAGPSQKPVDPSATINTQASSPPK